MYTENGAVVEVRRTIKVDLNDIDHTKPMDRTTYTDLLDKLQKGGGGHIEAVYQKLSTKIKSTTKTTNKTKHKSKKKKFLAPKHSYHPRNNQNDFGLNFALN